MLPEAGHDYFKIKRNLIPLITQKSSIYHKSTHTKSALRILSDADVINFVHLSAANIISFAHYIDC